MERISVEQRARIEKQRADAANLSVSLEKFSKIPGGMARVKEFVLNLKELKGEKYAASVLNGAFQISNMHAMIRLTYPMAQPIMEKVVTDAAFFMYFFADIDPEDMIIALGMLEGDAKDVLSAVGK
jgi:hypothetical protein